VTVAKFSDKSFAEKAVRFYREVVAIRPLLVNSSISLGL